MPNDDDAYDAFVAEEEARRERECGYQHITGGSDPWQFTCDLDKRHSGDHSMSDPMGPDTGTITWRSSCR